ncbi:MAG: GGDEF domain-containing protein [Aquisalimonadaceae bacterium]
MTTNPSPSPHERRRHQRRQQPDRRQNAAAPVRMDGPRLNRPSRFEQTVQALMRYLFCILGLLFFNIAFPQEPHLIPRDVINVVFVSYLFVNTASFIHLLIRPYCPWRYRLHLWLDICMVSLALIADPNDVPPAALAYIMVVLGNGMRYGMRMFGEAMIGAFAGAMLAISLRHAPGGFHPGLLFVNLFGGIILIYAYILMTRVEATRLALQRQSHMDSLTGLFNRGALEIFATALVDQAKQRGGQLTVLFADMDNFKRLNDSHGHSAGDRVLRQFGRIVNASIRGSDIAGRYGGDEFVVILQGCTLRDAQRVASRVRQQTLTWAKENKLGFSLSIGIAEIPLHGDDLEAVMHRVDQAMYEAKQIDSGIHLVSNSGNTNSGPQRTQPV